MIKYLAELHKKPDPHKRWFAMLASSTITLFIFGIWALTNFPPKADQPLAGGQNDNSNVAEVSPFQSFRSNLASGLEALKINFGTLKRGFEEMDFEIEYQEMKEGALDIYGR